MSRPRVFTMSDRLKAPFPWFGGKSRVADVVWSRFGDVPNYVEPFFGSGAVLLGRPHPPGVETINDADCYVSNFWRSISKDPEAVAEHADWPVNEADLHSRHLWLVNREEFRERMKTDPDYYDSKIAGWWVWGISQWIGSGWCVEPQWRGRCGIASKGRGIHAKRLLMRRGGSGVHRTKGLTSKTGRNGHRAGMAEIPWRTKPDISGNSGAAGRGVHAVGRREGLFKYFEALAARLRRVRVCCGDFARILGPSPTFHVGLTGVFLDPPYGGDVGRDPSIYAADDLQVSARARAWALKNGGHSKLRIALCGYEGEHDMPKDWECYAWKTHGGYAVRADSAGRKNRERERIWFSPNCLRPEREPELDFEQENGERRRG